MYSFKNDYSDGGHPQILKMMSETVELLEYKPSEDPDEELDQHCEYAINAIFEDEGFHIEGYTLREVSKWFLWYCHDWHAKNKEVQKQVREN